MAHWILYATFVTLYPMSSPQQKLAKVFSAQVSGLKSQIITIEVDIFRGFHSFSVVGLPDKAVEESRDRVSSAIKSVGFANPKSEGQQKIIVSLAPADLKKEGPLFDLPMSLAYLLAAKEIKFSPEGRLFLGELSLGGELQPLKGALLLAQGARDAGFKELFLPLENAREAALIEGISVFGAHTLKEVVAHINTLRFAPEVKIALDLPEEKLQPFPKTPFEPEPAEEGAVSLIDVRGQETAKRGLLIAAAGGHNIAFYGPPGTGKTLLAKAFVSILPPLSFSEALEVTGIHSTVRHLKGGLITYPPFRAPHHTSSHVAVIGGGTYPKPGEATLAHRGVLFLDEFPEFDRRVIESLREPLESGEVSISRARGSELFPAEFILIAAMNPCPCGFLNDPRKECVCSPSQTAKYKRKISGPIIDRIDMWIEVPRVEYEKLSGEKEMTKEEKKELEEMRASIARACATAEKRFGKTGRGNSRMSVRELARFASLGEKEKKVLNAAARGLSLSARAYHKITKLARTIADLAGEEKISEKHLLEAIQYRPKTTGF